MEIYNYDAQSGVLRGSSIADPNPVAPGTYLIPAFATTIEPPGATTNKTPVFASDVWSLIDDYRGQTAYNTATGKAETVNEIGQLSTLGLTLIAPPDYPATWNETRWVGDLAGVMAAKIDELKAARNAAEAATPFVYDGSNFDYDSLSRERIDAAVSAATIAAVSGTATSAVLATWVLADNTSREMTVADWLAFRQAEVSRSAICHATYNTLKERVEALAAEVIAGTKTEAAAITAINAIVWA